MEMSGTQQIVAKPDVVYAALNDPDVLRRCIPGCETIEKTSDTAMNAKVTLKIGPMKVTFNGKVTLSDLAPPKSYTITGEGSGGVAGFAKGSAAIQLAPEGDGTLLSYAVKADVGGKIAQLGARLIDGTAKKLAGDFFARLSAVIAPAAPQPDAATSSEEPDAAENANKPGWFGRTLGTT